MKYVSIGVNSKKYWFFLLGSITFVIRKYTFIIPEKIKCNELYKMLFMGIGMSITILFSFISRTKTNINSLTSVGVDNKKNVYKIVSLIIITSFVDCIGFFFSGETSKDFHGNEHIHYMTQFLVAAILSYFILKLEFYRHHFIFSVIIIVGFIIIILSNIPENKFSGANLNSLYVLIDGISDGVRAVIIKWILQNSFMSPFALPGFVGMCSVFFSVIALLVFKTHGQDAIPDFSDPIIMIHVSIYIIFSMGYNLFIYLVIHSFSPTHRVVLELFSTFIILIIDLSMGKVINNIIEAILLFIGHIIVLNGVIGFNEIFIYHCCRLDYYTSKVIDERANISINSDVEILKSIVPKEIHIEECG